MERLTKILRRVRWWQWLLVIDLLFVLATVAFRYVPDGPIKWNILWHLTLQNEMRIGAWWSAMNLALLALLAWELFGASFDCSRRSWGLFALMFAGLSFDEMGSLHERVFDMAGWLGFLPFALLMVAVLAAALFPLYRQSGTRRTAYLITMAFGLYALVALQEYFEHFLHWYWSGWIKGLREGLEEGTELAAFFLIFAGIVPIRVRRGSSRSLEAILPITSRLAHLSLVVIGALLFHLAITVATSTLPDLDSAQRGNPAAWFPVTLYLLLATGAFSTALLQGKAGKFNWTWLLVGVGALSLSLGGMYFAQLAVESELSYLSLLPFSLLPTATALLLIGFGKLRQLLIVCLLALFAAALVMIGVVFEIAPVASFMPGLYLWACALFIGLLKSLLETETAVLSSRTYLLLLAGLVALLFHSPIIWFAAAAVLAYGGTMLFLPNIAPTIAPRNREKQVSMQGK